MTSIDSRKSPFDPLIYEQEIDAYSADKVRSLLHRVVTICDKSNSIHVELSATSIINQFALSVLSLYGLHASEHFRLPRPIKIEIVPTIRGSTVTSTLIKEAPSSDLDIVLKCKILQDSFYDYGHFKEFCYNIAYDVLEKIAYYNNQSIHIDIKSLVEKTSGVFKSFYPFIDASRCIYSFSSAATGDEKKHVDVDITVLFQPILDKDRTLSLSPKVIGQLNLSPQFSLSGRDIYTRDAKSFVHDAVEIIIPTSNSLIDIRGRMIFKSLFRIPLTDIESHLLNKELIIIDANMHKGHCRLFYEISKGRVPFSSGQSDKTEINKCIEILSKTSDTKKAVELLVEFIHGKKKEPLFFYNFMTNAYVVIDILTHQTQQEENDSVLQFHGHLRDFKEELLIIFNKIHPVDSSIYLPLDILADVKSALAHIQSSPINFEKFSLGEYLRICAIDEIKHGFSVTRSLSPDNFLVLFKKLEKNPIANEMLLRELPEGISNIDIENEKKFKLIFFIRRLGQQHLSEHELQLIVPLFYETLQTIVQYFEAIELLLPKKALIEFINRYKSSLFYELECPLLRMILTDETMCHEDIFLSYIGLMTVKDFTIAPNSSREALDHLIYLQQKYKNSITASYVTNMLNERFDIERYSFSENLNLVFVEAFNEQIVQGDVSKCVVSYLQKAIKIIPCILGRFIDVEICQRLELDVYKLCNETPKVFDHLSHENKILVVEKAVKEKNTLLLRDYVTKKPILLIRYIKEYLKNHKEDGLIFFKEFCGDVEVKKTLLSKIFWLIDIHNFSQDLAMSLFVELRSVHVKEEIKKFITDTFNEDKLLAISCLLQISPLSQKAILLDLSKNLVTFVEDYSESLSRRTLSAILSMIKQVNMQDTNTNEDISLVYFLCLRSLVLKSAELSDIRIQEHVIFFFEHILDCMQRNVKQSINEKLCSLIMIFQHNQEIKNAISQSPSTKIRLEKELFYIDEEQINLNQYAELRLAKMIRPLSSDKIIEKIKKSPISEDTIRHLAEEHGHDIEILRLLIASRTPYFDGITSLLYERYINAEKSTSHHLRILKDCILYKASDDLIQKVLSALDFSQNNFQDIIQFFKENPEILQESSESIAKKILLVLIDHSFCHYQSSYIISCLGILGNSHIKKDDWYVERLEQICTECEKKFPSTLLYFLGNTENRNENILYHLKDLDTHTRYDILVNNLLLFLEKRKTELTSNESVYSLLKTSAMSSKINSLHLFYVFPHKFKEEDFEVLEGIILSSDHEVLYKILSKCSTHTLPNIIKITIETILKKEPPPITYKEKEILIGGLTILCDRTKEEDILHIVETFLFYVQNNECFFKLYKTLFQRALNSKNIPLINLLIVTPKDPSIKKELSKKQNNLRQKIESLLQNDECDPLFFMKAVKFISETWDVDLGPLLIDRFEKIIHKTNQHLNTISAIRYSSSIISKLTEEQISRLSDIISNFFNDMPLGFYLEHRELFHDSSLRRILDATNKKVIQRYTNDVLRIALSFEDPITLKKELLFFDELCIPLEKIPYHFLNDIISMLDQKIRSLLFSDLQNEHSLYNAVILSGLYCIFSVYAKKGYDKTSDLLQIVTPYIFHPNFTMVNDPHFLTAYCRICFSTENISKLDCLVDHMKSKLVNHQISVEDKKFYKDFLIKNITPLYLIHNEVVRIPTEKIISILILLDLGKKLDHKDLTFFIRFFEIHLNHIQHRQVQKDALAVNIQRADMPITGLDNNHEKHVDYFIETISKSPIEQISFSMVAKLVDILQSICVREHFVTKKVLRNVPSICEHILKATYSLPEVDAGIREIKDGGYNKSIRLTSLNHIAEIFYSTVPVILTHIEGIKISTFPSEPLNLTRVFDYYEAFLKKLDNLLGKQGPHPFANIVYPFESIPPQYLETALIFIQPLIDKALASQDVQEILSNLRLLIGISIYTKKLHEQKASVFSQRQIDRHNHYVSFLLTSLFDIVKQTATNKIQLNICDITYLLTISLSSFVIDPENNTERFCKISELFLIKESKKNKPDMACLVKIIEISHQYFIELQKIELFTLYLRRINTVLGQKVCKSIIDSSCQEIQSLYES